MPGPTRTAKPRKTVTGENRAQVTRRVAREKKSQTEAQQVKDERDFLLRRVELALKWGGSADEIGISSNAMIAFAMSQKAGTAMPEDSMNHPNDPSDLRRCENTYRAAPPHLQEKMLPILQNYRRHVSKRYPEVGC
jgi:hypothetical protein